MGIGHSRLPYLRALSSWASDLSRMLYGSCTDIKSSAQHASRGTKQRFTNGLFNIGLFIRSRAIVTKKSAKMAADTKLMLLVELVLLLFYAPSGVLSSHFRGGIIMIRPQPGGVSKEVSPLTFTTIIYTCTHFAFTAFTKASFAFTAFTKASLG